MSRNTPNKSARPSNRFELETRLKRVDANKKPKYRPDYRMAADERY